MFATDSKSQILEDIVIGTKKNLKATFAEEKDRSLPTLNVNFVKLIQDKYLQITGKKPSNKNIKELEQGLESLNLEIKQKKI